MIGEAKMHRRWAAYGLFAIACAGPALAEEPFAGVPEVEVSYYDVTGRNADQVRAAINKLHPTDPNDGVAVDALTRFRYGWRWPGDGKGGCDLGRTEVTFTAIVLLPRLAADAKLSAASRRRWDAYIAGLERHEAGHLSIAYAARSELLDAIQGATCETAGTAAMGVLAKIRADNIAYDKRTRHGQSEGAAFP